MSERNHKTAKSIRVLVQKAKGGDIDACFQLSQYYQTGQYVTQDIEKAQLYFEQFLGLFNTDRQFKLAKVVFKDFRRFNHLVLELDAKLTVIIGDNGAGKSTICDGIAALCSWPQKQMEKDTSAKQLVLGDINVDVLNDVDKYAQIEGNFRLNDKFSYELKLHESVPGAPNKKDNYLEDIRFIGHMYRRANANKTIDFPLFVYYSVERSNNSIKSIKSLEGFTDNKAVTRYSAYDKALEGSGKYQDFLRWFVELDNLANQEQPQALSTLETEIKLLQSLLAKQQLQDKTISQQLTQKQAEKTQLLATTSSHYRKQYQVIVDAITQIVVNVDGLYVDRSSGPALVKATSFGQDVNIEQLSAGQKTALGLCADLARRLFILNSHLDEPLKASGLVIIDEIELHLHPSWQQAFLPSLVNVFSGIQFVITTHSPQVLSTVDVKHIRQLQQDKHGHVIIHQPKFQTKGVASADILAKLMGTYAIPDIAESQWVIEFYSLLQSDDDKMKECLAKIEAHFGSEHPVTQDCYNQLEIQAMRRRLISNVDGAED